MAWSSSARSTDEGSGERALLAPCEPGTLAVALDHCRGLCSFAHGCSAFLCMSCDLSHLCVCILCLYMCILSIGAYSFVRRNWQVCLCCGTGEVSGCFLVGVVFSMSYGGLWCSWAGGYNVFVNTHIIYV